MTRASRMTAASAPRAPGRRKHADTGAPAPRIETLRHRRDFLAAAGARRQGTASFLLQARRRPGPSAEGGAASLVSPEAIRVGFTCSRKIGNAVTRNRAKRRLRAIAQAALPLAGRPGWDYVLVGRPGGTVTRPHAALLADLHEALARIHPRQDADDGPDHGRQETAAAGTMPPGRRNRTGDRS